MNESATLAAYLKTIETEKQLRELTTFDDNAGSSTINDTVLNAVCGASINWWKAKVGDYDPDTYEWHNTGAGDYAMGKLLMRAQRYEEAEARLAAAERIATAQTPMVRRRHMEPKQSSTSDDVYFQTNDDWDGYL